MMNCLNQDGESRPITAATLGNSSPTHPSSATTTRSTEAINSSKTACANETFIEVINPFDNPFDGKNFECLDNISGGCATSGTQGVNPQRNNIIPELATTARSAQTRSTDSHVDRLSYDPQILHHPSIEKSSPAVTSPQHLPQKQHRQTTMTQFVRSFVGEQEGIMDENKEMITNATYHIDCQSSRSAGTALLDGEISTKFTTLECDKTKEDDNYRRTTVTKGESSVWNEDGSRDTNSINGDVESNDYSSSTTITNPTPLVFCREKIVHCLLRIVHRMCHPHIHPPCSRRYWSNNTNQSFMQQQQPRGLSPHHRRILCRTLIILFMIVTITFTLLDLLILHKYLHDWLDSTLEWLHHNPISGGLAFIGIFLVGCLCFFPVALLSLGAGYVYIELYGLGLGIFYAFLVCYTGCLLGATVCFARSRYLMRQLIIRYADKYPYIRAVDRAFETKGFRLLLLLRLSPAMPMNALNYIGGITAISFSSYWWATCVGTFPGILWTIFVGATFGTVGARGVDGNKEFDRNSVRKGIVLGLGIVLGVVAIIGTAIYARAELKKIILAEQMERTNEEHERFMDDEIESGREDDSRSSVVSCIHSDNLKTSDWDDTSFTPSRDDVLRHHLRTASRHRGIPRQPWTPETVDEELPIIPKVILRCIGHDRGEETIPASVWPDAPSPKHRQRSASTSPWRRDIDSFESAKGNGHDVSSNTRVNITPPSTRRHSDGTIQGVSMTMMSESSKQARTSSDTQPVKDITPSLANIYETRALSNDQLFNESDTSMLMKTPPCAKKDCIANRRRCNTDPNDCRNQNDPLGNKINEGTKVMTSKRVSQMMSQEFSPSPRQDQILRSRHSCGSLHASHDSIDCSTNEYSPQRPRCNSLNTHLPRTTPERGELPDSLLFDKSPGLEIPERETQDDDPTDTPREWFWIWS